MSKCSPVQILERDIGRHDYQTWLASCEQEGESP